jgi:hypothetical protein
MRSRYQSIDEKHIQVHVKFENRLSIPFARKSRSKKSGTFSKDGLHFYNWRGLKN